MLVHDEAVAVLVYERLMSGMTGVELVPLIQALRPDVELILSSSQLDDGDGDGKPVFAVVPKPWTPAKMRTAVGVARAAIPYPYAGDPRR